jgi:predicted O-methyltransferase YrrM
MKNHSSIISLFLFVALFISCNGINYAQDIHKENPGDSELDRKVKAFLNSQKGKWHDLNIPLSDGELLYKIIVDNKYTRGLEIGTSTGHSGIWLAWAFSKTGGKLITIEIDESRYKEAMANFKKAGLNEFIDARLANAHDLVKELKGPFDFVFSDADKDWYINYFKDVSPKLVRGGCFTAHNVYPGGRGMRATQEYLKYVEALEDFNTTVDSTGGGVAISYKK